MNSEAVLDRETGLVWEQSPNSVATVWRSAEFHCNQLIKGGRLGWRLPTLQELASLIDPTQTQPALPAGHPFDSATVQSSNMSTYYWAGTSSGTDGAWIASFYPAPPAISVKTASHYVWCVRGGRGVDDQ